MKKRCFKCRQYKDKSLFYRHDAMKDGVLGKCKSCTKKDVAARYHKFFDRIAEYERRRRKDPERRKFIALAQKKYRQRSPGKKKARWVVSNAIRAGRLTRKPCEVCGSKKSQAHHDDYRRPLVVRWLCFKHHREIAHGQRVLAS